MLRDRATMPSPHLRRTDEELVVMPARVAGFCARSSPAAVFAHSGWPWLAEDAGGGSWIGAYGGWSWRPVMLLLSD